MRDAFVAFGAVFLAELPDKTMVATLLLTARTRRPLAVWFGVVAAFAVHVTVAVLAGSLLSRLPDALVSFVAGAVFAVGGVLMLRDDSAGEEDVRATTGSAWRVAGVGFATILVAELGDLTQLATAGMAATSGSALLTGLGAWCALASVAALAAFGGRALGSRLPVRTLRRVAGVVFLVLAAVAVGRGVTQL